MFQSTNCYNPNIKRGIRSTNFDDWTVKIFSSKNATTGHTKSFLLLNRFSFKFIWLILSNSTKRLGSSTIWYLTVLEIFLIFLWTEGGWYLTTWYNWPYRWWIFWTYFSMNFNGIKIWRPMLLINNRIVSNI